MKRWLLGIGGTLVGLVALRQLAIATAPDVTPPVSMADALPPNLLPACPSSRNCVRTSRIYPTTPSDLRRDAKAALQAMDALTITEDGPSCLHAVFRIFVFEDDVHLAIEPHDDGTVLHVRSASRVGNSDLGVNARRVARLLREIEARLG